MPTTFIKIEDRGGGLVAVLREYSLEFAANRKELENRVENMKRDNRDASTEEYALAEIRRLEAKTANQETCDGRA